MRYTVEFDEDTSIEIGRFAAAQGMSPELFIERIVEREVGGDKIDRPETTIQETSDER